MATVKMKITRNNKIHDGHFRKKHINHDPQTESAKAIFLTPRVEDLQ